MQVFPVRVLIVANSRMFCEGLAFTLASDCGFESCTYEAWDYFGESVEATGDPETATQVFGALDAVRNLLQIDLGGCCIYCDI